MSKQRLKVEQRTPIPADFWQKFRPFTQTFDEYCFEHWYLFTVGPYLVLIVLNIIRTFRAQNGTFLSLFDTIPFGIAGWIVISTTIALSLVALAFNSCWRHLTKALQELFDEERITSIRTDSDLAKEYQDFLEEYLCALRRKRRYLLSLALMALTLRLSLPPVTESLFLLANSDLLRSIGLTFMNVLAPLIWAYFVGVGVWMLYVTGIYLQKLTEKFNLCIQPSHPDKCGGLRSLGDLCLRMALPILIAAIFFSIFGLGGVFDNRNAITIGANVTLFFIALPLAALAFWAPLWNVHREMVEQRRKYENEFAEQVTKLQEKIRIFLDKRELKNAKSARDELEIQEILHPDRIGYPSWPFDRNILLRFLTPQILPFISLLSTLRDPVISAVRNALSIFTEP
jgi:hypothetical protein